LIGRRRRRRRCGVSLFFVKGEERKVIQPLSQDKVNRRMEMGEDNYGNV